MIMIMIMIMIIIMILIPMTMTMMDSMIIYDDHFLQAAFQDELDKKIHK